MKRFFLVVAQVICYVIFYELLAWVSIFIIAILSSLVNNFSLFRLRIIYDSVQLIALTLIPLYLGVIVCSIIGLIFKHKFDIISFFISLAIFSFGFISNAIQNASAYGFFSNDFLTSIWTGLIIGITLFFSLFKMTGYNLKKENEEFSEIQE